MKVDFVPTCPDFSAVTYTAIFEGCLAVSTQSNILLPSRPHRHSPVQTLRELTYPYKRSVLKNAHRSLSDNGPKISKEDGYKVWHSHGPWDQAVINVHRQQFVQLSAWLPKPCESWQKQDDKVQTFLQTRIRCTFVYWNQSKTEATLWVRKGHTACCSLSVIGLRVGWLEGKYKDKT